MMLTVVLAAALLFGLGAVAGRIGGTPSSVSWPGAEASRPACHQHLAALAWVAGDVATAAREVSLGLAADDTAAGLWQLRARLDAAAGRLDAALADLDRVVARAPTVDALVEQARMLTAAGRDPAPALRLADAAHRLFTANGGTDDLGAAALALAAGRPAEAAEFATHEWGRREFAEVADAGSSCWSCPCSRCCSRRGPRTLIRSATSRSTSSRR